MKQSLKEIPKFGYAIGTLSVLYKNAMQTNNFFLADQISKNEQLKIELEASGYVRGRTKVLTIKQVETIFNYLGVPLLNSNNKEILNFHRIEYEEVESSEN